MEFEFVLDAPIENLDTVPSAFQHMYEKGDNGFSVAETHHGAAKAFNGLHANLTSARKNSNAKNEESAARRKRVQALEDGFRTLGITDFDDEDAFTNALKDFQANAKKGKNAPDVETQLNNLRTQMTDAHGKAIGSKDEEIQGLEGELRHLLVDSQFTAALAGADATSLGIKALPKLVEKNIRVVKGDNGRQVEILDDRGNIMYTASGDNLTISEYVESLKENEEYGAFFKSKVPGGADTKQIKKAKLPSHQRDVNSRSSVSKIAAGLEKMKSGR